MNSYKRSGSEEEIVKQLYVYETYKPTPKGVLDKYEVFYVNVNERAWHVSIQRTCGRKASLNKEGCVPPRSVEYVKHIEIVKPARWWDEFSRKPNSNISIWNPDEVLKIVESFCNYSTYTDAYHSSPKAEIGWLPELTYMYLGWLRDRGYGDFVDKIYKDRKYYKETLPNLKIS